MSPRCHHSDRCRAAALTHEAVGGSFEAGAEATRTTRFPGRHTGYVHRVIVPEPPRLLGVIASAVPLLSARLTRNRALSNTGSPREVGLENQLA